MYEHDDIIPGYGGLASLSVVCKSDKARISKNLYREDKHNVRQSISMVCINVL